jgi:hypothetical protein
MFCVLPKLGDCCWLKLGLENDEEELPKPPVDDAPNAEDPPNGELVVVPYVLPCGNSCIVGSAASIV